MLEFQNWIIDVMFFRARGLSFNEKVQSGQTQSHPRPWTADVQGWPSEDYRRRLGLHRPGIITILNMYFSKCFLTNFHQRQYDV